MYSADLNVSCGIANRSEEVVLDMEYSRNLACDDPVQLLGFVSVRPLDFLNRTPEGAIGFQVDIQHAARP